MQILIATLVSVTLAEMMFAIGLRLSFSKLMDSMRGSRWLIFRATMANYLIIPGITLFIILLFQVSPMMAAGILILAVSPAAPYGLPFTVIARGNLAMSTGLMVILAGTSALMAPLLLYLLLPVISSDELTLTIDTVKLLGNLFAVQLVPLGFGLSLGQWKPELSAKWVIPADRVSKVLNFLMIMSIAALQYKVIVEIGPMELSLMIILVLAGIVSGWMMGWPGKENRISLSIITSLRNMSLSIGIAATSFPGSPVLTTILAYSFVAGFGVLAFAWVLRLTR
jgi:BASS family bile acid:Na+ symporter